MTNSASPIDDTHVHAVRFYEDDDSLCRIVGGFLTDGFAEGSPAIVIATPTHRDGIAKCLIERSVDVEERQHAGDLLFLDAHESLAAFMVDGMPDSGRFHAAFAHVIHKAARGRKDRTVRAYGEMVDVLWKEGLQTAAIRLEVLWNQLANTQRFSLLCGYSMGNFYKDAAFVDICRQHTHVVSPEGELAPSAIAPVN